MASLALPSSLLPTSPLLSTSPLPSTPPCTCLPPGLLPLRLEVPCGRCSAAQAWALATMLEEEATLPACPPGILHAYKTSGAWSAARAEQEDARVVADFVQHPEVAPSLRTKTKDVAAPERQKYEAPQKKTAAKKTKNLEAADKSLKIAVKVKKEGGDTKKICRNVAKTNVKVKKETNLEVEVKTEHDIKVESETEVKVKQENDHDMKMEVKPDAEVVVKEEIDSEISYESKVKVEQETAESMEIEVKTEPETEVNVSSIIDKYKFLHAKKEDDVTMEIEVKTEPEADVLSILDRYKNIEDNKVTMEEAACQDVKVEEVKEEHDEEVAGDAVKVIKSDIKPELAATKKVQKSADCDKCDKKFKNSYNLKQHYTLHTGETPYGCKECPLKFPNKGALMRHRQKIHTKPTN